MNWDKYGIDISKVRGGKTICPNCSHTRKNKIDPCLSVDKETGLFNCHNNCGFKGCAAETERPEKKKVYEKPVPRLQKLADDFINWFGKRGITNNTLLRFGITEGSEWMHKAQKEIRVVCFNYILDGELRNIKFRGGNKDFKLSKGSELLFYNLDAVKGLKTAIIVEGEIDALSFYEAGIYDVVSVPNGASMGNQKLEYLDNCWHLFEDKERIIIATDNDQPGIALREELARRLGKERCYKVVFPEGCKDANDVLLNKGKDELKAMIEGATQWPIEGVLTMDDMYEEVCDYYLNGYPQGCKLQISEDFDNHLQLVGGQLTMATGVPGSGKSEFVDLIAVNAAKFHGWTWAMVGFEQPSKIHVTKLIEKIIGKSFAFRKNPFNRVSEDEFKQGIGFIDTYFHFVNIDEVDVTMDGLIEKFTELVKRKGIKGIVIDPWNYIEYKTAPGQNETQYVSECLTKLIRFLKRYDVHGILIAHPTKLRKENGKYEVPTLYSISGSAHFFNKTHNGIAITRDFDTGTVDVYIQKVKYSWLGKIGCCSFNFDTETRQYTPL